MQVPRLRRRKKARRLRDDKTAKVWDAETGEELLILRGHSNGVSGVADSPDGKRLATASADGTVQVYAIDNRELLNLARGRVNRNLLENASATSSQRPARLCPEFSGSSTIACYW